MRVYRCKMKLNKWQRIGVVLSCLWMLYAAFDTRKGQMRYAQAGLDIASQLCTNGAGEIGDCLSRARFQFEEASALDGLAIMEIATAMLFPVLVAWLLLWIVLKLYRWIMAG